MRKFFSCVCLTVLLSLPVFAGDIPIGANPTPVPPTCSTCATTQTAPGDIPIGASLILILADLIWP